MKKALLKLSFFLFAINSFSQADIQVTNTDNKSEFMLNSTNTYVVEVLNNGPDAATNVVIDDKVPPCINSMSWSGNGKSGEGNLHDYIPKLAAGKKVTYTIVMQIPSSYKCPDPQNSQVTLVNLINTVIVSNGAYNPNPTSPMWQDVDVPAAVVTIDTNKYTVEQLVTDVLVNIPCAQISDFSSTASCGFGYFNRNNSDFPIREGMVIRSGLAQTTKGRYDSNIPLSSTCSNDGDAELQAINCKAGNCSTIKDASSVKFNFVAGGDIFRFNYLFASNEYGFYQCDYSDAFAFILTDLTDPTEPVKNLAVVPGTTVPVSVTSIRKKMYNNACNDSNPQYFGQYNESPAANIAASDINMKGQTGLLFASAHVIPGHRYGIKLVIGDYGDDLLDSAVFIEAGSFSIGPPTIVSDNMPDNVKLCPGSTYIIKSGDAKYPDVTYSWERNGVLIPGADNYFLEVNQDGVYKIICSYGHGCDQTDSCVVSYYGLPVTLQEANDLKVCQGLVNTFDLSKNVAAVLGDLNPEDFKITYYHSQSDAENFINPIMNIINYAGNNESIVMTVEYLGFTSDCVPTKTFKLLFTSPAPSTDAPIQGFSDGATVGDLKVTGSYIKWYSSADGMDFLANETLLENNKTYYATQTIDGCESTARLAVTVQAALGMNKACILNLTYSPNPVKDVLSIQSGEMIESVSVSNLLGQELYRGTHNLSNVQLDMSAYPMGTYFVRAQAGSKSTVFKIVKE